MSGLSTADTSAIVFLALIVLIMARRTYLLSQGAPYSTGRVFGYGGFSMVLFGYLAASTLYVAWTVWGDVAFALIAPYAGVVVGAALFAAPHVRRRVTFESRGDGRIYYRLPLLLPLLSLVLFVARVAAEIAMFGLASLASFAVPTSVSVTQLSVLIAFDLLYGSSIGLLIGRGLGVRSAFRARGKPEDQPLAS
ncbi:MAG TPA: hypothetical protein VEL82_05465 [Thermoplasmata archaeon]|nr:hypothetical protein [Thermoplasmata archaeon]